MLPILVALPAFLFAQNETKQFSFIDFPQTVLTALKKDAKQVFSFPKVAIPGEIMQQNTIDIEEMNLKGVNSLTTEGSLWKVEFAETVTEKDLRDFFKKIGY